MAKKTVKKKVVEITSAIEAQLAGEVELLKCRTNILEARLDRIVAALSTAKRITKDM